MGRAGITYIDVCNAIASIQGMQKNPTVDSIREELGTGSRSTIAKYFQEWKTKNGVSNTTEAGIPIELQNLIQSLWEKIQADADNKIEKHQIEIDEEINTVKNQLAQTQQQNALLHDEINLLAEKLSSQINTANALTTKLQQSENEKLKCDERIDSLEIQNNNHKAENDRLHQLLKNTQDNLIHYQNTVEKQRQDQQMQSEKERAEYTLKLSVLEKQISKMSEEKSVIETKYQLLIDECQIQKSNLKKLEDEKSHLQLKNNERTVENNHLNLENEKLQKEIFIVKTQLKESENAHYKTKTQLAIFENENAALNKKCESHENKTNLMQSQINTLLQENGSLKQSILTA